MNRMISYYELLGMIKDGNIPKKVKLHMCGTTRIYVADYDDEDFSDYCLENIDDKSVDFRYYLGECFLESDMFEENIEITEEENKIEKLPHYSLERIQKAPTKDTWLDERTTLLEKRVNDYHNKINEIIDEINKLKEKE